MSDDIREGQNMSETHELKKLEEENNQAADVSRRKFAKLGLLGAPIIMTLTSRPVLGAYQCTVSGQMSGNLSNFDPNVSQCFSLSQGVWSSQSVLGDPVPVQTFQSTFSTGKKRKREGGTTTTYTYPNHYWPYPYTPETPFHSVFQSTAPYNYGDATLVDVMRSSESTKNGGLGIHDDQNVGFKAVGALLNAQFFGQQYFGYDADWVIKTWNTWSGSTLDLAEFFDALNHRWDGLSPHPSSGSPA